jgi:hypothetical protein
MRPGTEVAIGAAVLVMLGVGAAALGSRRARTGDSDPRRSTYLVGPSGASAYAEALGRLGVRVDRSRLPLGSLDRAALSSAVVAFLGPTVPLTSAEGAVIARLPADLLLAGPTAAPAMRCLGYDVVRGMGDSIAVTRSASADSLPAPFVGRLLRERAEHVVTDSSDLSDDRVVSCVVPPAVKTDTLLTVLNRPVAIRLTLGSGHQAVLVSDDRFFSNRALRETAAGPLALALVYPRYRHLIVDEYHHGFDASGSLAGATLAWSTRSPWGWAVWQLVIVGILALLAGAIRFGPVRRVIERRRRSPLEHVRALATALAAAGGHDVAVRLIVQGLRRRVGHGGARDKEPPAAWLGTLAESARTPRGRTALSRLTGIAGRHASADEVLEAAEDVEILWEELKPT